MFTDVALQQMPEKLQQLSGILQQASQILIDEYQIFVSGQDFDISNKSDHSPVTQADLKSNAYISQQLSDLTPDLPILSEEGEFSERRNWQQFWMLDPLDGTKEFIHQTGEFTINLSLIQQHESVISAIAVPLKQTIYIVEKGHLPFKWQWHQQSIVLKQYQTPNIVNKQPLRIAMSRRPERSQLYPEFLAYLTQHNISHITMAAGSAYKFCLMLENEADIYPRFHPTSEWDTAAGQGLLQSIGGEIFDLKQQPFTYNQRDTLLNQQFIALRNINDWQLITDFISSV